MHSSRMLTGHSLTICCSLLLRGGAWIWSPQFPPWVWAWTWSPSISPLDVGLDQKATPPEQTHTHESRHPSGADTPSRSRHPPGADTPQEKTPLWEQTPPPPRSRHPPWSRHPLPQEQTPPMEQTHPPGSRHPPEQTPPWRPAARHAGIPPAMHAGIAHSPCVQNHRHE